MITLHQLGWLKEYLLWRCESETEREQALEIAGTFRKLWAVAQAAEQNPHPRSLKLEEALAATKKPPHSLRGEG